MKEYYEKFVEKHWVLDKNNNFFQSILDPENKCILDIGCGWGHKTHYLTKKNTVIGFDILYNLLKSAKNNKIRGVCATADTTLPFKNDVFDMVICSEVLEHLVLPENIIKEIKRIVKKEGLAFITIPNTFTMMNRINILFGCSLEEKIGYNTPFKEFNTPHIRFFTWAGFKYFLNKNGFIISSNYSHMIPSVPHFSLKFFNYNIVSPLNKILWVLVQRIFKYKYPSLFSTSFWVLCKIEK